MNRTGPDELVFWHGSRLRRYRSRKKRESRPVENHRVVWYRNATDCRAASAFVTLCEEMSSEKIGAEEIDRLVDEYRDRCLWFLRRDFYPKTLEERLRVLGYIERHGDRSGFQRAAQARQWLLQNSRKESAAS